MTEYVGSDESLLTFNTSAPQLWTDSHEMIPHLNFVPEKVFIATFKQTSRTSQILTLFMLGSIIVIEYIPTAFV